MLEEPAIDSIRTAIRHSGAGILLSAQGIDLSFLASRCQPPETGRAVHGLWPCVPSAPHASTGRSAVPLALSVDTLAGPSSSPRSLGLIGAASTFTITSSDEG